jgi:hypothetical protein
MVQARRGLPPVAVRQAQQVLPIGGVQPQPPAHLDRLYFVGQSIFLRHDRPSHARIRPSILPYLARVCGETAWNFQAGTKRLTVKRIIGAYVNASALARILSWSLLILLFWPSHEKVCGKPFVRNRRGQPLFRT